MSQFIDQTAVGPYCFLDVLTVAFCSGFFHFLRVLLAVSGWLSDKSKVVSDTLY